MTVLVSSSQVPYEQEIDQVMTIDVITEMDEWRRTQCAREAARIVWNF
jgi:hypothetical protein